MDGATEQPQWGAISTTRPEVGGATPQTECGPAKQPLRSKLGGGLTITINGEERTEDQLHSPRCYGQTKINHYFHTENFGSNGEIVHEEVIGLAGGGVIQEMSSPDVEGDGIPDLADNGPETHVLTTPSMRKSGNENGNMEKVRGEEDISGGKRTTDTSNECKLDKKRLRCTKHDCDLKMMNVTSKNGNGLRKNASMDSLLKNLRSMCVCGYVGYSRIQGVARSNRW